MLKIISIIHYTGVVLLKKIDNEGKIDYELIGRKNFVNEREIQLEVDLKPGKYVIIPMYSLIYIKTILLLILKIYIYQVK